MLVIRVRHDADDKTGSMGTSTVDLKYQLGRTRGVGDIEHPGSLSPNCRTQPLGPLTSIRIWRWRRRGSPDRVTFDCAMDCARCAAQPAPVSRIRTPQIQRPPSPPRSPSPSPNASIHPPPMSMLPLLSVRPPISHTLLLAIRARYVGAVSVISRGCGVAQSMAGAPQCASVTPTGHCPRTRAVCEATN